MAGGQSIRSFAIANSMSWAMQLLESIRVGRPHRERGQVERSQVQSHECRKSDTLEQSERNKESRVLALITTHQGTVSSSGKLVAAKDKTRSITTYSSMEGGTGDASTYTDAEWRQWRTEPEALGQWSTWQWQGVPHFPHSRAVQCQVPEESTSGRRVQTPTGTQGTFELTTSVHTSSVLATVKHFLQTASFCRSLVLSLSFSCSEQ